MTYTTSTTKTKATQYDLPGIEDKVPNIWSLVKVAYDKYVLWGISHWREQRKSFNTYARGRQSRGDVYSTKRILAVSHVKVMRKHGYGYLEEIIVRRADKALYRFKEGDFPRLRINDIEDMLILVVHNRLINISRDDDADFAIALRMFTRSLFIQKRVKDLQLRKLSAARDDWTILIWEQICIAELNGTHVRSCFELILMWGQGKANVVGVCVLPIGAGIVLLTPIFVLYIFGCALNSSEVIMVKSAPSKLMLVIRGPQTPLDLGRCDAYGLVTYS
ncbi:hypothetical protein Tco_0242159 [Tanacetum coccineum]